MWPFKSNNIPQGDMTGIVIRSECEKVVDTIELATARRILGKRMLELSFSDPTNFCRKKLIKERLEDIKNGKH